MTLASWFVGLGALVALLSYALISARRSKERRPYQLVAVEREKR